MSINQRIRDRRQALGLTLRGFAKLLELRSWTTVQHWERNTAPARRRVGDVARVLQVSEEWLLTGRGPMQPSVIAAFSELTGNEAQLIMFYRNLSVAEQTEVLQIAHDFNIKYRDKFGGTPLKLPNSIPDAMENSKKKSQSA